MDAIPSGTPSFEERFAALASLSYRVGYRLVGDRAEAEDLAQEALARAYASWHKVATYDEAWVARVTTNLAVGRWRKSRRLVGGVAGDGHRAGNRAHDRGTGRDGAVVRYTGQLERGSSAHLAPPPDPLDRLELVAALRALPRRQREVVALRYLADLSETGVAAALGCSPGTVKQHAHRGLRTLRRRLGHLGGMSGVTTAEEESRVRSLG